MSQPQPSAIAPLLEPEGDQEERLERATILLDDILLYMGLLIGTRNLRARVDARVVVAQRKLSGATP